MHDIAPHTTTSDRAASHGHKRHAAPSEPGASEPSPLATLPPADPPHQRTREHEHPAPRSASSITDLDEGDILLHVVGTGLGPLFCAFVCEQAIRLRLRGWARCESGALTIRVVGRESELVTLVHEIRVHAPADCSVRGIEPDAGDGGAPLPDEGFIPIVAESAGVALATGTVAAAGPDW